MGIPQTVGAINGTQIPIVKLWKSGAVYYNYKGYYSILMQAVVDFRCLFLDIYIGWPGKVHDTHVLVNSKVYQKATSGTLLPDWSIRLGGVKVPLVLLGDPAYPLLQWLMKAYVESPSTPSQEQLFNYRLSRARMVIENAFG